MITPSFGLDFTTAILDSRVTFIRATSASNPATYINSNGYVTVATNNQPRFDYNPVTLSCQGLLIEESRTNNCLQSADASVIPWTTSVGGLGTISRTQNYTVAPDNTPTATRVLMSLNGGTATSNFCWFSQPVAVTSGVTYTVSFYAKTNDNITKTISVRDDSAAATFNTLKTITGSWSRIVVTGVAGSTTNASFKIWLRGGIGTSADADISVWGFQWETGAFATSYIPTTTTALTRNADVATITGANFSSWWVASQGGVTANFRPSTVSGTRPIIQYDDGTANEIITLRGNTTNPELYIVDGGAPQAQIDAGTIAANTDYSLTGWWQTNDCRAKLGSGAQVIDNTATIPTVTQARIGSDGTNYLNGHIASISYYDSFTSQIYNRRKNKAIFSIM